jgi:hypothetical protein
MSRAGSVSSGNRHAAGSYNANTGTYHGGTYNSATGNYHGGSYNPSTGTATRSAGNTYGGYGHSTTTYNGMSSTSRTTVNGSTQVNQNVNVNRNVNVDVDNHSAYGSGWNTAAAVAGTAIVTAAAIGSVQHAIPPSCVPVVRYGVNYQQCGNTWYQPQYAGTSVTYVVVAAP